MSGLEGGEDSVTLTSAQMPEHTHTFSGSSHRHTFYLGSSASGSNWAEEGSNDVLFLHHIYGYNNGRTTEWCFADFGWHYSCSYNW